jgi:hypothetical protein
MRAILLQRMAILLKKKLEIQGYKLQLKRLCEDCRIKGVDELK